MVVLGAELLYYINKMQWKETKKMKEIILLLSIHPSLPASIDPTLSATSFAAAHVAIVLIKSHSAMQSSADGRW